MANEIRIATGDTESETFVPETTFLIYSSALPTGTPTTTFTIQMRPTGDDSLTWFAAKADNHLTNTTRVALVNGSPGFEYRLERTAGTTTAARTFYWDHVPSLRAIYR